VQVYFYLYEKKIKNIQEHKIATTTFGRKTAHRFTFIS